VLIKQARPVGSFQQVSIVARNFAIESCFYPQEDSLIRRLLKIMKKRERPFVRKLANESRAVWQRS